MKACEWHGTEKVKLVDRGIPVCLVPTDAVVRITSTTICGSDLHMYTNTVKGMKKGDILGHEGVGVVQQVGTGVSKFKQGDRVIIPFDISCGACFYCQNGLYTCCDNTNPSTEMQKSYGHRICGAFGYTHLTGGYPGLQAEYARVPLAEFNLLKIPEGVPDEKVLLLTDVACTAWHANECGFVSPGHVVAIWGAGPVGIMAAAWARFRGAARVIIIDKVPYRLEFARTRLGVETIDFSQQDVIKTIQRLVPGGPDVCIEAAGFRFPTHTTQKLQLQVGLQTDSSDIITEMVHVLRKGGTLSLIGDYFETANQFPIGPIMEKAILMRGGQCPVQRYWQLLLSYVVEGHFDPSFLFTHVKPLEDIEEMYHCFDKRLDNVVKLVLKTQFGFKVSLGDPKSNIAAQPFSEAFLKGEESPAAKFLRGRRAQGLTGELTDLTLSQTTPQLLTPHEGEPVANNLHKLALGISERSAIYQLSKAEIVGNPELDAGKTAIPEVRPSTAV